MTKKTIRKPENWQDFESLCKRLWGEIWEIPTKIKKNGRQGQTQHGVDVYGKPKGENKYSGIQCKGKDAYTHAPLTEKEIDAEIEKAKYFEPALSTFIFATTANKDAKIEEYIRLKDQESKFEILLYCWEDIADLIEDYRDTFNWYVNNVEHKDKFDFNVLFENFTETTIIRPKFKRITRKFTYQNRSVQDSINATKSILEGLNRKEWEKLSPMHNVVSIFGYPKKINLSWIDLTVILENCGSQVLEDWFFWMKFTKGVRVLDDERDPISGIALANLSPENPVYKNREKKSINYKPRNNAPLIQSDNRFFETSILVEHNVNSIEFEWELKARNFKLSGNKVIQIEPEYIEEAITEYVYDQDEVREEFEILDYEVDR